MSSTAKIVRGVDKRHAVSTPGGEVDQWWTDPRFAAAVVRWAGIRAGMRVIDFGAGLGSLTLAALGMGATVVAVEIDPRIEKRLRARVGDRCEVVRADFFDRALVSLMRTSTFDIAIGNPPWSGKHETDFLRRAIELAPRAVGIISLDGLVTKGRWESGWAHMRRTREMHVPARISFSPDGSTGQEHCVVVEVVPRLVPRQDGEEDLVRQSYYVPPKRADR